MLPSQYPEVQNYSHLQKLLADHIDMQFEDIRLLLGQPSGSSAVGGNLATAALLFNAISGASVCFYKTSWPGFTATSGSGAKFRNALKDHFPFVEVKIAPTEAIKVFYSYSRNPLAHSFGLGDPAKREVWIAKNPLTKRQITELEDSAKLPMWSRPAIWETGIKPPPLSYTIGISGLYWGVHRMLQSIFADSKQAVAADLVAKRLGF